MHIRAYSELIMPMLYHNDDRGSGHPLSHLVRGLTGRVRERCRWQRNAQEPGHYRTAVRYRNHKATRAVTASYSNTCTCTCTKVVLGRINIKSATYSSSKKKRENTLQMLTVRSQQVDGHGVMCGRTHARCCLKV
jgi:hypothetical protein